MDSSQASSPSQKSSRSRRSTRTRPTADGGTNKSFSPYHRAFQQVLVDSHVYPPYYGHPDNRGMPKPKNWDDINERLTRPRPSLSPSNFSTEEHEAFIRQDASAAEEIQVKTEVIPIIRGTIEDPRTASGDILFTNLDPLNADENFAPGKPDFFHGARPEQLDRRITHRAGALDYSFYVARPAYRAEPLHRCERPRRFRSRREPTSYAEPRYDGKTRTIGTLYQNGLLQLFTSHPIQPASPGEPPSYYLNRLRSFAMCNTVESWRAGATRYRNSMKWAQEERDDAIRVANEVLNQQVPVVPPFASNAGASFSSRGSQLGEEEEDDEHQQGLFSCWKIAKERIDSLIGSLSFEAGHSPPGG
ncbi:hypothetical protein MMC15_006357 [Xylographa vitiligo]|nr:hypothetical protein [Xylographa vitiligo]